MRISDAFLRGWYLSASFLNLKDSNKNCSTNLRAIDLSIISVAAQMQDLEVVLLVHFSMRQYLN
jgi:hypothetical protein